MTNNAALITSFVYHFTYKSLGVELLGQRVLWHYNFDIPVFFSIESHQQYVRVAASLYPLQYTVNFLIFGSLTSEKSLPTFDYMVSLTREFALPA